jgi:beta-galactosidase
LYPRQALAGNERLAMVEGSWLRFLSPAAARAGKHRADTQENVQMWRMLLSMGWAAMVLTGVGGQTAAAEPPPSQVRSGMSLDLGGAWRVQPARAPTAAPCAAPESWGRLDLPGQAEQWQPGQGALWQQADTDAVPALWLEREIKIPSAWAGKRIVLRAELIEQPIAVFVMTEHVGGLTPPGDSLDASAALKAGRSNLLRLFIAADARPRDPGLWAGADPGALAQWGAAVPSGRLGVAGALRLDAIAPRVAVEEVFLTPSVRRHELGARVRLNCARRRERVTIRAVVTESDGRPVRTFETTLEKVAAGETLRDVAFPWRDPVLWEIDRPHLYRIAVQALDARRRVLDEWGPQRFGFREFWVAGREMMLNGHPCRFRLIWHWGVGENNLAFYQGIGFNAIEIQPVEPAWFGNWGRNTDIDTLADLADRRGVALIATCKMANPFEHTRAIPPLMRDYYVRASRIRIWRYANHPSILVWNIAMNAAAEAREWMPPLIGQDPTGARARNPIAEAARLVQRLDRSRSVIAHAGGNVAPIASANLYLNFLPLQEREEWLSDWARGGKRPFACSEFGPPYHANFYRKGGPEPLFTEYCAMFVGDDAYRREQTAYVAAVADITQRNVSGHGTDVRATFDDTAFFPVVSEFVRRTNRSWRAWGHNGGSLPWMFNVGFGGEAGGPMNAYFYTHLSGAPEQLRQRPPWANAYYDAYRETMPPLLVYIGGRAERFTEHDHGFFPGQTVTKQIIAVWDEGWPREIAATWEAFVGRERVAGDTVKIDLRAGDIRKLPFSFTLPGRRDLSGPERKAQGRIELTVRDAQGARLCADSFSFEVIPQPKPVAASRNVLLWDPRGESGPWIARLGSKPIAWWPGEALGDASVLIIGREALTDAAALPFTLDDLARGLTVLMLEQQPTTLRRLGLRAEETYSRRLFPRIKEHPVLAGIDAAMLENWRGSATLLPQFEPMRWNGVRPRVCHVGNYGVVASVVIETPHHGGFTPIIDGEFDLRYSPLIEWRWGKGRILFSQLDLTGRVGEDAAATAVAANLLHYAVHPPPVGCRCAIYFGGPAGRKLATDTLLDVRCDVSWEQLPAALRGARLLIIGEGAGASLGALRDDLSRFVSEGGFILSLPKSVAELNQGWLPFAVRTEQRAAHRAGAETIGLPPFRGLGPADFHWRDVATFTVFSSEGQPAEAQVAGDGFFLWAPVGTKGGAWLLCQADPAPFAEENAGTIELPVEPTGFQFADYPQTRVVPKPWLRYTRQRIERTYAQIMANLGAGPRREVGERMMLFMAPPDFAPIPGWQYTRAAAQANFDTAAPPGPGAEWQSAIARDFDNRAPAVEWSNRSAVSFFRAAYIAPRAGTAAIRIRHSGSARIAIWCNGALVGQFTGDVSRWRWAHERFASVREGRNDFLVKIQGPAWFEFGLRPPPQCDTAAPGCGALAGPAQRWVNLLYRDPQLYGDDPFAWYPW